MLPTELDKLRSWPPSSLSADYSCPRMVSSNLYNYNQLPAPLHSYLHVVAKDKMDSVIDLSDASKALDLARIRAQLM